jgi:hypothetical protein
MRKWKWLLIITGVLVLTGWYFLFYKTASERNIPANADVVMAIDVKKNTRTLLYYYITNPSQWSLGSVFSKQKDSLPDWKDAVKIPDYIFIFHVKEQPLSALYCRLALKSESAFKKLMALFNFKETVNENRQTAYYNEQLQVGIIKKDDQLLLGTIAVNDKLLMDAVAYELFNKNKFIADNLLKDILAHSNHFTVWFNKNSFLEDAFILNGNLKNGQLNTTGLMQPSKKLPLNEASFEVPDSSLLNIGFTQPLPEVYNLLPAVFKTSISTAVNFNIDSLFIPQNKKYQLDITGIISKTDSAVSYSYDDDFNKIEKVVVNTIQEPVLTCTVFGEAPAQIFNYWKRNKNIEPGNAGYLFTPIPFAKTYAAVLTDTLLLSTADYNKINHCHPVTCIINLSIWPSKLPLNAGNYLPDIYLPFIKTISSVNVTASKEKGFVKIDMMFTAADKNKPFLLNFGW